MSFRKQPSPPDKPDVTCVKGHRLRQREWAERPYCLEGECPDPECEIPGRKDFVEKCKESLDK